MSQYRRLTALCVAAVATAGAVAATANTAGATPRVHGVDGTGMIGRPVTGKPFATAQATPQATPKAAPRLGAAPAQPSDTGGHFVSTPPTRFYDTRTSGSGQIRGGTILPLDFPAGTIDKRVTAITFNLAATNASQDTTLTVWDGQGPLPDSAQLSVRKGETRANQITIPIVRDTKGTAHIYIANRSGNVDAILDTEGAYGGGTPDTGQVYNGYLAQPNTTRVYDTKATGGGGPLGAGATRTVDLSKAVSKDATAVTLNMTVASHGAGGYLTVYPANSRRGDVSSINVQAGETTANQVTVPLSPTKTINVYNSAGSNDVALDLEGTFVPDATNPTAGLYYSNNTPTRVMDTRDGTGLPNAGPLDPQETVMPAVGGDPLRTTAVIGNLTAQASTAATFLTVWPSGTRPTVSTLNLANTQIAQNAIATGVLNDQLSVYNNAGKTPAVLDISGYYMTAPTSTQ